MALTRPKDGILALLSVNGPMTTAALEQRVEGASALLDDMEMLRLIHRTPAGWAAGRQPLADDGATIRVMPHDELEIMIRYEVGQLPPYLVQRMRSRNPSERQAACDEVAKRISRRFERMTISYPHQPYVVMDHGAAGAKGREPGIE